MTNERLFNLIDSKIERLEEIQHNNTVLGPSAKGGIYALRDLKREIKEQAEPEVNANA